jgi:hypothetical protein
MARLPEPGKDDGVWGDILNDYLSISLRPDGLIKDGVITEAAIASDISQEKVSGLTSDLASKEPLIIPGSASQYFRGDKSWQLLDKSAVGLANVDNVGSSTLLNRANHTGTQTSSTISDFSTAADSRIASATGVSVQGYDANTTVLGNTATGTGAIVRATSPTITTPLGIVKGDVGLGNVDNTSDANKPVSTAQQTALNGKTDTSTTSALDARVGALESATVVNLTDAATIATNAAAGKHFRVSIAADRTLGVPSNPTDGMHRIWEVTALTAPRILTLTTGSAGSFELTTNISAAITITTGKALFLGAIYNSTRSRWTVLAARETL